MDTCFMHLNDFIECRWNVWLWRTVPILQLIFGTLGNVMNILILLRKRLRTYSSTVYLVLLAVADLSTLWTWAFCDMLVQGFGRDVRGSSQFYCKILVYVSSTAGGYSMWLVVLLSIERMMLVQFPHFSRSNLTRRSALITALACLGATASLLGYVLFTFEIRYFEIKSDNETVKYVCEWLSDEKTSRLILMIFFSLIPVTLLLIANGVIIVTIFKRRRLCTVNPVGRVHKYNIYKKTKSSTRMILFISAFFIFTTFPFIFYQAFDTSPENDQDLARKILLKSIFIFVLYSNYSFNFILYCVSGTIFREEFQMFVREYKQKLFTLLSCIDARRSTTTSDILSTIDGNLRVKNRQ